MRLLINLTGEAITVADDENSDQEPLPEHVWREARLWRDEQAMRLSALGYIPLEHGVDWDWEDSHSYAVDYYAIIETSEDPEDVWDTLAAEFVGVESVSLEMYA